MLASVSCPGRVGGIEYAHLERETGSENGRQHGEVVAENGAVQ